MEIISNGDYHNVKKNWDNLKEEIGLLKKETDLFLINPDKRRSGIKVRKVSFIAEQFILKLRRGITKERQDIMSDYS